MIKIEEIIEKAKNGDKEAFSELIMDIESYLYKIARTKLHNEEDIQDAVQNTIINAYLNIKNLKSNKYFKTWITRILINECHRIYRYSAKNNKLIDDYIYEENFDKSDENINFEELISSLDEIKKEVFRLYYNENWSIKKISAKLNMNENTIKSILHRGRKLLKENLKHIFIILLILCTCITTGAIAFSVINYLKNLFEINSVGAQNDGVLSAIEDSDWYQQIDMDYINLTDEYQWKIEYILIDEMTFYLVVDVNSTEDLSKFNNFSITDLYISNENNDVICDRNHILNNQSQRCIGDKLLYKDNHNMKSLIFMYTDGFPLSEKLNISFSKLTFYTMKIQKTINVNAYFQIQPASKFNERNSIIYNSDSKEIQKAIISETGFYSIIRINNPNIEKIKVVDNNNIEYPCYVHSLSERDDVNYYEYIITANINYHAEKIFLYLPNNTLELYCYN